MPTRLYFSNTIESLANQFARDIVACNEWSDPCTVIVPNPYVQKWLQLETARINGVVMNIRFRILTDGLWEILEENDNDPEKPILIDQAEFRLLLYRAVKKLNLGAVDAAPLAGYLFDTSGEKMPDYEERAWQLTLRLARYFHEYEIYREEMIDAWINGELLYNTEMESAQRHLYLSLFQDGGIRNLQHGLRLTLPGYWRRARTFASLHLGSRIFIFGEARLSPLHASMIHELGKELDITMYQVNPCSEFWEDITTTGEDRWKRIRSISIDSYPDGDILSANEYENPLLKYWGKTGRETIKLLSLLEDAGSKELRFISEWIEPDEPSDDSTCLSEVRRQMLGRFSPIENAGTMRQDTSIQIASCTDLYREAEAVYNSILHNLAHSADLRMTDIAVMVPDMALYGPVIESVFSREPRCVSYCIIDSTAVTDSLFGKAVRAILDLASGSFTRKEVFDLISNQCFLEARSLSARDAEIWLEWADALMIFRGFSHTGVADHESNLYTWEQGLRRLRLGRIMLSPQSHYERGLFSDYSGVVPYADMNTRDRELLDAFNLAIELLHEKTSRLKLLRAPGSDWYHIISGLIDEFLVIPASMPEESFIKFRLIEALRNLSLLDRFTEDGDNNSCSLPFIKEYIGEYLASIPSSRGNYLADGVNVSALIPNRLIPFQIIYVMGMQEGVFPGTADTSTLNLMTIRRKIGDISRPDLNRYLFLEIILSVRKKLYLTYVSKDLQKDQDFYPNSVVTQFLTYLNGHVLADNFVVAHVPPTGCSTEYLRAGTAIDSGSDIIASIEEGNYHPAVYGISDRLLLLERAFGHNARTADLRRIVTDRITSINPVFTQLHDIDTPPSEGAAVSLRDLTIFLLNPAESALRWHLTLYDEENEDVSLLEDEPFYSQPRSQSRFISNALNYYIRTGSEADIFAFIEASYRHLSLKSMTPDGAFASIDFDHMRDTVIGRIGSKGGINSFLKERKGFRFICDITLGSPPPGVEPGMKFSPLIVSLARDAGAILVKLNGYLPFLWKNPATGVSESLIITNSATPSLAHILPHFLFFAASASGLHPEITREIGSGAFIIHVSHRRGITSFTYDRPCSEYTDYIIRLLSDFLDSSSFDLLPLGLIAGSRIIQPPEMKSRPDQDEKEHYRQTLIRLISEDAEKPFPSFRPMKIFDLIESEVPEDAYEKARDRLAMPLTPFFRVPSS